MTEHRHRLRSLLAIALGVLALVALPLRSYAQRHTHDARTYVDYGDPLQVGAIRSADGLSLEVRLATMNALFSFQRARSAAGASDRGYYALRDVTFEVREEASGADAASGRVVNGPVLISRDRLDTLYVSTFEQSTSKQEWQALSETLSLAKLDPTRSYTLRVEVRDGIDRLVMQPVLLPIRPAGLRDQADSSGIGIADIRLADSTRGLTLYSSGRGNSYMFSRDLSGAIALRLAPSLLAEGMMPSVDISVRQLGNLFDAADTGERGTVHLTPEDLHAGEGIVLQHEGSQLAYARVPDTTRGSYVATFTLPGQHFTPGRYRLTTMISTPSGVHRTHLDDVSIEWQNMPVSLVDVTTALPPMKYILSEKAFSDMASGSKSEIRKKLWDYWRTQDPTPATAFNERMATFYERVDHADFNFGSTQRFDGVMSDRGRVYVLFGAPTHVERTFLPGESPVETWTYSNNVAKVFRFVDRGHGDYSLVDVKSQAALH